MTYMPSRLFPRGARPIARPIYRFAGCRGCCCLLRCFSCCCRVSRPSQHRCPPIHRLWVHRESRCQATRTVASYWHASHSRCLRARFFLLSSVAISGGGPPSFLLPSFLPSSPEYGWILRRGGDYGEGWCRARGRRTLVERLAILGLRQGWFFILIFFLFG